jgi:hypothetical protein
MDVLLHVAGNETVELLISTGIVLVGAVLAIAAAVYVCIRYVERKKIEAASIRVLQEYPEFAQTKEDFRVFARKVLGELGWNSVSFTFD